MPGKKYASIKRPLVYESLRKRGYSEQKAARIANAGTSHRKRSRMAKKAARTKRGRR